MHKPLLPLYLLGLLTACGCAKHVRVTQVSAEGCYLIENPCSLKLKQSKFSLDFGGLTFTSAPVSKVGEVKIGTDLMQKMTDIAQILDQDQYATCQRSNRLRTCDKDRDTVLAALDLEHAQITQLAIIVQGSSGKPDAIEKALEQWIVRTSDLLDKIYAKQFTGTNPEVEAKLAKAHAASQYALNKLNVSPGTPEYQQILMNPAQAALQ